MSRTKKTLKPDLHSMSSGNLQDRIRTCVYKETTARFNKGRRAWKAARMEAEAELQRRLDKNENKGNNS